MFTTTDTIVAIATPAGRAGLGVLRLSGPQAVTIAGALTGRYDFVPRYATFARLLDPATSRGSMVDEVIVTWFQSPRSYTGEDVVEIAAHGSPVILHRILELALAAGARLAEPGEFTLRAYLHGRLDLVQAEAVADLIDAVTPLQARAAMDQLEGTLTRRIAAIDAALFDLMARLEASIDFPEEGFHFVSRDRASDELEAVADSLDALRRDGRRGRMIRDGSLVVIAGRPNAGKSSLFNAIVGSARAIVTDVAGTTRDALSERVDICGFPVTLVDTAGLRESLDPIEAEGVRRAREAQAAASLTLIVLDGSTPLGDDDMAILRRNERQLIVLSKSDLPAAWPIDELSAAGALRVSVVDGTGLNELREKIAVALGGADERQEPPAITNLRHLTLVDDAVDAVRRARSALLSGATEELVLAELSDARMALEAVVGRRAPDDLLEHIFSRFCIGK